MNSFLILKENGMFFSKVTREIPFDGNSFELIQTELEPNNYTDVWNGTEWIDNSIIVVPQEISRMKFKMQIRRSTYYSYEIIVAYIENMSVSEIFTADMKQDILDRLHDCVKFERYSPDFIMLANMMNVSDAIKDEIFIEGNKIQ